MSAWTESSPAFQRLVRSVCTNRQLTVYILRSNGMTFEAIGTELGISAPTVHQHHRVAEGKIRNALIRYNYLTTGTVTTKRITAATT